ncbi:MAG: hypothetical protein ACOC2W_04940 [bacterium]
MKTKKRKYQKIIFTSLISLIFIFLSSYTIQAACTEIGIVDFTNSIGTSCTIEDSSVINSNVTNSIIRDSQIENVSIYDATIINNIITSGRIIYQNYIYYPVYNVSNIYNQLPISI